MDFNDIRNLNNKYSEDGSIEANKASPLQQSDEPLFGDFGIKELVETFEQFDADQNNYISAHDLFAIYENMKMNVSKDTLHSILTMIDTSNDGQISFSEYAEFVIHVSNGNVKNKYVQKQINYLDTLSREDRRIATFGKNDRQKVQKNEFAEYMKPNKAISAVIDKSIIKSSQQFHLYESKYIFEAICNEFRFMNAETLKSAFQKCKQRATKKWYDDIIELEYFCKCLNISKESKSYKLLLQFKVIFDEKEMVKYRAMMLGLVMAVIEDHDALVDFMYDIFDKDGSQTVEMNELLEMICATNPTADTPKDIDALVKKAKFIMKECDSDQNGVLDKKEFVELAQRFPNLVFPQM